MNSKMQAIKLVTILVAFFAVIIFPINSYADHDWNNYHWARTSNPFTLRVVDSTTSIWASQQSTAIADWNNSSVMDLTAEQGDESSNARRRCVMISGKIHSCNYTYGSNGWLGLASINISGSHITQGSSKMNDTYFNTSTYNNPNEKLHVMCQEIGHTFGLGHTSEDGSSQNTCMDYFSNTGANATSTLSTRPNQHDYDMLASIYAHLDSTTTIAASSASSVPASEEVTNEPNSWGQLMSQSANGRSSTYEREHSNGSKTATHVFWTEEVAENCPRCDHRYQ